MFNKIIIEGRVTSDPTVTKTANGTQVANFSIANNTVYSKEERTTFIKCVAFNKLAEFAKDRATKGRLLLISGRYFETKYEKKDGTAGYKNGVIAESIEPLDKRKEDEGKEKPTPRDEAMPTSNPVSYGGTPSDEPRDIVPPELPF